MKKKIIRKGDYNRVLITETIPYETPIIFSNDGLYESIQSLTCSGALYNEIFKALVLGEHRAQKKYTIPYLYKIRKSSNGFRRLALIHPISQWKIKCFYEKYSQLIIHYCSLSPASIRSPSRVAGSYYTKSSWENISQYKSSGVSTELLDRYTRHTPSYFSYSGYNRLYKFFNSRDFFELEKKFSVLSTLDVSKCFDSIYTHSLAWAIKDKAFVKESIRSHTFAKEFDDVIKHCNHLETNGIPIGPEVSRIFSEIIFQEIDIQTIRSLNGMEFGIDYAFRRYVDDVFIFAHDEKCSRLIYETYSDKLLRFNLHANLEKSTTVIRPFITEKSKTILAATRETDLFIGKFLDSKEIGSLHPKAIKSPWKLTKSYIISIKSICLPDGRGYDEVASFIISVITERIKILVNISDIEKSNTDTLIYISAIEVMLDVLFFFYSVSPSVAASYKLSTSIILSTRFTKAHASEYTERICHKILDLSTSLLNDQTIKQHPEGVEGFINLESINIILSIRELGEYHLLPQEIISYIFDKDKEKTYFTIISCLYYIRDEEKYTEIRSKITSFIDHKLSDLSDIMVNSEKTHLLLDLLACPFIESSIKEAWTKMLCTAIGYKEPGKVELKAFLGDIRNTRIHVDWSNVDLLNSLEKRELMQAY